MYKCRFVKQESIDLGPTLSPSDKRKYIGASLNIRLVNYEQDE